MKGDTMAATIPAVAYYRMSSDKQETSIANQRTAVEQYAVNREYRVVRAAHGRALLRV